MTGPTLLHHVGHPTAILALGNLLARFVVANFLVEVVVATVALRDEMKNVARVMATLADRKVLAEVMQNTATEVPDNATVNTAGVLKANTVMENIAMANTVTVSIMIGNMPDRVTNIVVRTSDSATVAVARVVQALVLAARAGWGRGAEACMLAVGADAVSRSVVACTLVRVSTGLAIAVTSAASHSVVSRDMVLADVGVPLLIAASTVRTLDITSILDIANTSGIADIMVTSSPIMTTTLVTTNSVTMTSDTTSINSLIVAMTDITATTSCIMRKTITLGLVTPVAITTCAIMTTINPTHGTRTITEVTTADLEIEVLATAVPVTEVGMLVNSGIIAVTRGAIGKTVVREIAARVTVAAKIVVRMAEVLVARPRVVQVPEVLKVVPRCSADLAFP